MKITPPLANFGTIGGVAADAPVTRTVTLSRGDGPPIKPRFVQPPPDSVKGEIKEIEPGEKYELILTMTDPPPRARYYTNLSIASGLDDAPPNRVRVAATRAPRVRLQPARVILSADVSSPQVHRVLVHWLSGAPAKLTDVRMVNGGDLTARVLEEDGKQYIVVEAPAGYTPAARGRPMVRVRTTDPVSPVLTVQILSPRPAIPARRPMVQPVRPTVRQPG